nr:hypothetical protein RNT25_01765 [arsenite-oxidising bacterium NT-25]
MLWLIGMSEPKIAAVLLKRPKQISGIVTRSPFANRSAMTDGQRQAALDELASVRFGEDGKPIDGGILDKVPMKIIPLQGKQRKARSSNGGNRTGHSR